jgi:intracellular sulfur oxidation DsrE/DsrF family protein
MPTTRAIFAALAASAALLPCSSARGADDQAALHGLKEGKIVFDVTSAGGHELLDRLEAIDETRQDLVRQGVTPRLVLTFRGGATRLVQTDAEKVKPEDRPFLPQIAAKLQQMVKAGGVESVEQCSLAIRKQGTKAELVVPPVKVVGNSFISLMAYQAKGYAVIRP